MAQQAIKQDPMAMEVADDAFRTMMRERQDPQAKEWVRLDDEARKKEYRAGEYQNEIDKRKAMGGTIVEIENNLSDARNQRDALIAIGRPHLFQRSQREAYDKRLEGLNAEVNDQRHALQEVARKTSPEKLAELAERMQTKLKDHDAAVAERQGIAVLPSERLSMQERIAQSRDAWKPEQQQHGERLAGGQSQGQQQSDGTAAGRRLAPNMNAARETEETLAKENQLREDQLTMHQRLGRPATDQEMKDYIAQREAAEQRAKQEQRPMSQ